MPWLGHSYAMRNSRPVLSVVLLAELPYGIQDLTVDLDWLGVDKDESDHTGLSAAIDPIVDRAALHEHVARLQMDDRVIELHVDLTRHDDGIINGIRPVVPWRNPGRELDDAKDPCRCSMSYRPAAVPGRCRLCCLREKIPWSRPHRPSLPAGPRRGFWRLRRS